MKINSLQLTNFRNYKKCQVQLSSGINVLLGENAQGKTNLLESLSFVSSLRSFRINNESQLIYFDKETISAVLGVPPIILSISEP